MLLLISILIEIQNYRVDIQYIDPVPLFLYLTLTISTIKCTCMLLLHSHIPQVISVCYLAQLRGRGITSSNTKKSLSHVRITLPDDTQLIDDVRLLYAINTTVEVDFTYRLMLWCVIWY